jgi:uncharacterized membrane protein YgdD (TMEM256/DUF423 family)
MTASPPRSADRLLFTAAAAFGFVGVTAGAFGSHALKKQLTPEMLAVYGTATQYLMYHVVAILAAAWAWARWQQRVFVVAGAFFITGMLLFSGSLYALALTGTRWLGAITPVGGLCLLVGWMLMAGGAYRGHSTGFES